MRRKGYDAFTSGPEFSFKEIIVNFQNSRMLSDCLQLLLCDRVSFISYNRKPLLAIVTYTVIDVDVISQSKFHSTKFLFQMYNVLFCTTKYYTTPNCREQYALCISWSHGLHDWKIITLGFLSVRNGKSINFKVLPNLIYKSTTTCKQPIYLHVGSWRKKKNKKIIYHTPLIHILLGSCTCGLEHHKPGQCFSEYEFCECSTQFLGMYQVGLGVLV